jgi:hypothetical protein
MSDREEDLTPEDPEISNEMDETTEDSSVDETVSEMETTDETKEDELVEKAKAHGHLTLEEFVAKGGDPKAYKTEKEFALTGELIDLKKALTKRDKDIEEIIKYHKTALDKQREAARRALEEKLQEAKSMGDVDAVQSLTAEKTQADLQDQTEQLRRVQEEQSDVLNDFCSRNASWYNDNHPELKQRCAVVEKIIIAQHPYITPRALADQIEKQLRYEISQDPRYAETVKEEPKRPNLSATKSGVVQSGSTGSEGSDDKLYNKLSANEKAMYNIHKRIAAKVGEKVTVKEFLQQMQEDGSI